MLNSIRGLLNANKSNNNTLLDNVKDNNYMLTCDSNVGGTILKHYQDKWAELHEISEHNARTVAQIAESIQSTSMIVNKKQEHATHIMNLMSTNLQTSIDNCVIQLKQLHFMFEDVEKSLFNLEDIIECIELQDKKRQQENELVKYKQSKLVSLEESRCVHEAKHTKKVLEQELNQKKLMQERQQAFQEAFEDDLKTYKQTGSIPKIQVPSSSGALLEEIQLDCDNEELDQFLK